MGEQPKLRLVGPPNPPTDPVTRLKAEADIIVNDAILLAGEVQFRDPSRQARDSLVAILSVGHECKVIADQIRGMVR